MDTNTTISNLTDIGLTEREAKVYRVLLGVSEITAAAIPKFTDIPRTKVYEVLGTLIRKGFCKEVPSSDSTQNAQTFAAVSPKVAIEGIMAAEKARMRRLEELNVSLTRELLEIYEQSTTRLRDYDFIEIIRGRQEIVRRYTQIRNACKEEILELSPGDFAMTKEEVNAEADENEKLIASGVEIRVIYERSEIISGENRYFHRRNKAAGLRTRMLETLPMKVSIFDRTTAILPLSDPALEVPNLTVLIIEHRSLCKILMNAFDLYWSQAEETDPYLEGF